NEVVALKRLVHGRRLVQPAGYRLEVVNTEGVGVEVAIPAHHIKRRVGVDELVQLALLAHLHQIVALAFLQNKL
nr:hypothetical protein [Tanacetum cinerariifolium]